MKKIFIPISAFLFFFLLQTSFNSLKTGHFAFVNNTFASEQEADTWIVDTWSKDDEENKEDKLKVIKNLNAILVGSYKTKLDQILDVLKDNIKDETKENQIKTFSTILIPINSKIKTIETKKELWANRKEVLLEVLKHIKNNLEVDIKDLLNEK